MHVGSTMSQPKQVTGIFRNIAEPTKAAKFGMLTDYETGEIIRPATAEEGTASCAAALFDGGAGVIRVAGRRVFVPVETLVWSDIVCTKSEANVWITDGQEGSFAFTELPLEEVLALYESVCDYRESRAEDGSNEWRDGRPLVMSARQLREAGNYDSICATVTHVYDTPAEWEAKQPSKTRVS